MLVEVLKEKCREGDCQEVQQKFAELTCSCQPLLQPHRLDYGHCIPGAADTLEVSKPPSSTLIVLSSRFPARDGA